MFSLCQFSLSTSSFWWKITPSSVTSDQSAFLCRYYVLVHTHTHTHTQWHTYTACFCLFSFACRWTGMPEFSGFDAISVCIIVKKGEMKSLCFSLVSSISRHGPVCILVKGYPFTFMEGNYTGRRISSVHGFRTWRTGMGLVPNLCLPVDMVSYILSNSEQLSWIGSHRSCLLPWTEIARRFQHDMAPNTDSRKTPKSQFTSYLFHIYCLKQSKSMPLSFWTTTMSISQRRQFP